jgi:type II secretory pathway component PulF
MLLRSQDGKSTAATRIPIAMMLISIGMMFIVFGIVWPRLVSPVAHTGTDWHDFLRGLCYGLGISFDIGGLIVAITAVAAVAESEKKL